MLVATEPDSKLFADAIITYAKDLYCGAELSKWIINDQISPKYAADDEEQILDKLVAMRNATELCALVTSLEPTDAVLSDLFRWMHHFHFSQFIVVNIPSATLSYYTEGNTRLSMKVVVGKPTTRTPRFSAYCKEIILYPYWHVPQSIATKELLPKFKKNPSAIERQNMQVITKSGKVVDHRSISWSRYSGANFPYIFRQYTGCDNALGVIKFNLTDPFDVYMHDTNFKTAFARQSRFLSHGCIRLEKPIELGNNLLDDTLNKEFLEACVKGQKPIVKKLQEPIPVFVVYMPATAENGKVVFYKDIYRLFQ
ncbi:MAG: ErfK/YbiS/YcfS/YnhG family protein [Flavipsychrobacter sp.]|nr:ErfK/YbiS/YcfS/YnhG family protein [Flavipsychrobacter sp.]